MASIYDVLRHLVLHGPARNDREREELLAAVDEQETVPAQAEHAKNDGGTK